MTERNRCDITHISTTFCGSPQTTELNDEDRVKHKKMTPDNNDIDLPQP